MISASSSDEASDSTEEQEEEEDPESSDSSDSLSDSELVSWSIAGSSIGGLSMSWATNSGGPGPGSSQDMDRGSEEREQSVVCDTAMASMSRVEVKLAAGSQLKEEVRSL